MIVRIWRGWTERSKADRYEEILLRQVIPGIQAMQLAGFQEIQVLRRDATEAEVEFTTLMWFDSLEAVKAFAGEDHEVAHVPDEARRVLARFDPRAAHHDLRAIRSGDGHVEPPEVIQRPD